MSNALKIFMFVWLFNSTVSIAGGITVGGTRVVYDASKREALINVSNSDTNPYLIQSWVEFPEEKQGKSPFVITPPLFRLDGNSENLLRIVNTINDLPDSKESLFWINIKAVPSSKNEQDKNTLQIAIKTKIKLIYRPASLKGSPEESAKNLEWKQVGNKLTIINPTPFIMNFQSIKVGEYVVENPTYIMPNSQHTYELPNQVRGSVSWSIINDFGGISELLTSNK
ncbi:molecular chaperone [Providencia rettgeri]|nr:molecular chaperone [Providencia rettgeri]ELL9156012.1 molecular chaperone [Providencia rettgeri]ELR5152500.1 molecular chaperone [Providencia rettgeri]